MAVETKRIAIVGAGAAGLAASWLAGRDTSAHLTVYESREQLGGHANTVEVDGVPIDTGFLVFNEGSYPNLCGLFQELRVGTEPTDMSFGVSLKQRTFEWSSDSISALFATRKNLISPAFHSMIRDMVRFHEIAPAFLERCKGDAKAGRLSLREFLDEYGFGTPIRTWYLIPHAAAVWSAAEKEVMDFPAQTFIQFFSNHALLQLLDRPQWYTVTKRSREYVRRIAASLPPSRSTIHVGCKVAQVTHLPSTQSTRGQWSVTDARGITTEFDHVVFGAHPDEALAMLTNPTPQLRAVLGRFNFQPNKAYLHSDPALMPKSRIAWSSWNYMGKGVPGDAPPSASGAGEPSEPCCVTYWLNRLQNLPSSMRDLFVTLNPSPDNLPHPSTILRTFDYSHPQYSAETVAAQEQLGELNGVGNLWFAGAYLGYGFHEDAITAGLRVAHRITGCIPPWWHRSMYSVPRMFEGEALAASPLASPLGGGADGREASRPTMALMRRGGSPFWVDNLGNGGSVGVATRAVAEATSECLALAVPSSSSAHTTTTAAANHTATYPADVLHTFNLMHGLGGEESGVDACVPLLDDLLHARKGKKAAYTDSKVLTPVSAHPPTLTPRQLQALVLSTMATRRFVGEIGSAATPTRGGMPGATTTPSLWHLMAGGPGGYTHQQKPVTTPDVFPSTATWLWDIVKRSVLHSAVAPILRFFRQAVTLGCLQLRLPDGYVHTFGDFSAPALYRVRLVVHSWSFFLRVGAEADLGLARSFMAGEWSTDDLTALFKVFVLNRDNSAKSSTARLWTAWIGSTVNYAVFALSMDNSISGSRKNIHAHYDLSNDLFRSFLDPTTLMYSSAIFDTSRKYVREVDLTTSKTPFHGRCAAQPQPSVVSTPLTTRGEGVGGGSGVLSASSYALHAPLRSELTYGGSLEEAQVRKLDHLIARANVQRSDIVLDLGFGWGGLSIRLAETVGCRVHGITLSKQQHDLAAQRVLERGLGHLITFEIVDYRDFAREHPGEFDKIISVEMVEAVGHTYFPSYMAAVDRLLAPNGVVVLQAITIPDSRYEAYIHSTDFINTIIFPGGSLPSIGALTAAAAKTTLCLTTLDDFTLHYAETLRRWRANFNSVLDSVVRPLGFDDAFIRTWNYYFCYCEAGFATQTIGLQILTYQRPQTESVMVGHPVGALATSLGPYINTPETAHLIPAGEW